MKKIKESNSITIIDGYVDNVLCLSQNKNGKRENGPQITNFKINSIQDIR